MDVTLPVHGSSFDDTPLPLSGSSFDQDTVHAPEDVRVGTGISGIPAVPATWADVGHEFMGGVHELGATSAGLAASVSAYPELEASWRQTAAQQQQAAEESRAAETPTAQPGWGHPMMWAAGQAPGLAALAIPAAVGTAVAGPAGGAAVLSGVMAGQTRGDIYNRLVEQGITPTREALTAATALGAATGLAMEATGGLAKEIPVSPLVQRALGITGDAATFGASGAAQEYTSQKAEIAAGKRSDLDLSAILSSGTSQAEFGAAFGLTHLLGHGREAGETGRNLAAKPNETGSEQGRTPPDVRVAETKHGEPAAAEPTAAPAGGRQPDAIVTPDIERALAPDAEKIKPVLAPPVREAVTEPLAREPAPAPAPEALAREAAPASMAAEAPIPASMAGEPAVEPARPPEGPTALRSAQEAAAGPTVEAAPIRAEGPAVPPRGETVAAPAREVVPAPREEVAHEEVTPRVTEEAAPAAPLTTVLARNERTGIELRQDAEGNYQTVKDGVVTPRTPQQARIFFPGIFTDLVAKGEGTGLAADRLAPEEQRRGKVLRAEPTTPEAKEQLREASVRQQRTIAENLKAMEAKKAEEKAVAAVGRKGSKEQAAKLEQDKAAADRIVAEHPTPPLTYNWPKEVYDHAKALADAAKEAKIDVPSDFREGHPHNANMLKLREAMDLVRKENPKKEEYGRFISRENLIDTGRGEEAFADRRSESAEAGALGAPEGAVEPRPGKHEAAEELPAEAETRAPLEEARERPAPKVEGEAYRTFKPRTAAEFKRETVRPRWQKQEGEGIVGAPKEEPKEGGVELAGISGKTTVYPSRITTAEQAIKETYKVGRYAAGAPQAMNKLRDIVVKIAGNTPVHYITEEEMERVTGNPSLGAFHEQGLDGKPVIILNSEANTFDTPLHEAFHAATEVAMEKNPELKDLMERLRVEVLKNLPDLNKEQRRNIGYFFTNYKEFLTGMMTNPRMQEYLKGVKISDQLARDIGIPKWRKMTMWEGALAIIRDALGLGPRDTTAIEAAMSLAEQTMWRDPRGVGELMQATGRMANKQLEGKWSLQRAPAERDQEAFIRSPKETFDRVKSIDRDMMKELGKDKITNLSAALIKGSAKALSGAWMNDVHGHLFEDAKGKILEAINHARDKVWNTYSELMKDDRSIINRGLILDQTQASHMADYAKLINLSLTHNIHADRAAPSIPAKPWGAARKNWQRDKYGDEARAIYNHLPEALQERYRTEKKFAMDKQAQMAEHTLRNVLPLFDPPKGHTLDDVMDRALKNELTDDDWDHYDKLGVSDALQKAYRLANKTDVFFNAQREGRWVTKGRYEMPAGGAEKDYSGELLPDNKREFNTEQEAHAYATGTRMHAVTREIHYWTDKATGETERVTHDFATSDPGTKTTKYQVRLERQNVQMADSPAEAQRNRATMEADGVKELSGVLDKRDEKAWSQINTADQKALERKINGRQGLTDMEKQHMRDMTRTMMLSSQTGMSSHYIQSRKVAGGKFDTGLGLQAYARAVNYAIAKQSHAPELSQAMDRMEAHERANQSDENATRRSIVANEYRDRVYGKNSDILSSKASPLLHRIMTYAFINFLARPSHIFLSQIHPWIYSVPMLGARHGIWKAAQGQRQAMKDLGGVMPNLWAGGKAGFDVFRAGYQKDVDEAVRMGLGVDPIDRMIASLKNPEERDFLSKMRQTGHLHSAFDSSVFSGEGLDRTNAAVRQFTDAMEANNRLSTALNAYRLEKSMHGDRAQALAYSRRVIEESHGVYTPTNTAPIFRNPLMKAMMQFHQQPMNLATMMYRNMSKAAMGDTEARWTLAYQLGTAAAIGGMGGMPLDVPKLATIALMPLGAPSPDDWADKEHRFLADNFGEGVANTIDNGLTAMMGSFGPSIGHRAGFDAGFIYGSPKSGSATDMLDFFAKQAVGAGAGMGMNWMDAARNLEAGNYQQAMEDALPGSFRDFAKAYRLGTQGQVTPRGQVIYPGSVGDTLLQALGFSSVERERALAGHQALQKAVKAQQTQQALTKGQQLKQAYRAKQSVLGVGVTPKTRALAQEYQRAYQ